MKIILHKCRPLAIGLLAAIFAASPEQILSQDAPASKPAAKAASTVELSLRFADGRVRQFDAVPYREGMTVADLMNDLKARKENALRFEQKGSGSTAFLLSIDGVANQSSQSKDFWIYRVNGKLGDRSFGTYPLRPGDKVLWHLGKYKPE